jgi:protein-S-isoprenylcysteine O-methyltransferase Ste14
MVLTPELGIGWFNGWLPLCLYGLLFGALLVIFPKDVVARLFEEPKAGDSRALRVAPIIGRLFAFGSLVVVVFSPLRVGSAVFVMGSILYGLGLAVVVKALFDFRNTPPGQTVTGGVYRLSRNPQWVGLALLLIGVGFAVGSWLVLSMLGVVVVCYHFQILAEEKTCLEQYGASYQDYLNRAPRYFLLF